MTPEIPAKKKSKNFIIPAGFYAGKIVEEHLDRPIEAKKDTVNKIVSTPKQELVVIAVPEREPIVKEPLPNRRKSILSLKSLTEDKQNKKKKKVAINYDDLPKTPFTKEQFSQLWKQNISKLNAKNEKLLASLLNSISFKVQDNFKIELTLPNARMQQEIDKSKGKVLHFFRDELQNYAIDFIYVVNEEEEKKFAYTPQEKYEFLKEKNPLISVLRKTLDLDV